jgi:hypothetical protein
MNDISDLKRAMDTPPDYTPVDLDLGGIVQAGGRLRRRRRLAVGSAAAAAVVVVLVGGSQLIGGQQSPDRGTTMAPAAAPTPATPEPSPTRSADEGKPYGSLIETGLKTKGGVWVLYAVKIDEPSLPGTSFGIMLGVRPVSGPPVPVVVINETDGSGLAPGFHEGEGVSNLDDRDTVAFGYYVGKPKTIRAKADGRPVSAHLGTWSRNPSVTVFWFSPGDIGPGTKVTGLTAYDGQGKKMVSGRPGFGMG